jgi:serralysin
VYYAPSANYAPNAAEIAAYTQIFNDISAIANISFVLGTPANADIVLNAGTGAQMAAEMGVSASSLGVAHTPGGNVVAGDQQSWVFANRDAYNVNGLNKGGYDYITWLHEIGHALGLAHPHDNGGTSTIYPGVTGPFGSYGTGNLNQGIFTTMSYNDGWSPSSGTMPKQYGWQATMMAFDVAALQLLYGANYNTATGNDYYVLGDTAGAGAMYKCIWDAGGTDAIYYAGNNGVLLDLRAATLTTGYGAGGFVSYATTTSLVYSAFTIANGVTVENAFSGNGADTLVGNDSGNWLFSSAGNDSIYGLGGADYAHGGSGNDIIFGGGGNDQLVGSLGNDYLIGEAGTDYFNVAYEMVAGELDYFIDFTYGTDYVLVPTSMQGAVFFFQSGTSAYGYGALGGGTYYLFGAANSTVAQLQASTFYI